MEIVISIVIIILSVIAHELAHGYMAEHLGDPTPRMAGRLTLNPIKHLDFFGSFLVPLFLALTSPIVIGWAKPVPFNPLNIKDRRWGGAKVAFAGPAINLLIALVFGLLLRFGVLDAGMIPVARSIVAINLVLAVFNLVPVPPLDGHHILFALLGNGYSKVKIFLMENSMWVFIVLLLFLWQFIFPLVGFLQTLIIGR